MTVKELIEQLQEFDEDCIVIIQALRPSFEYDECAGVDDDAVWRPDEHLVYDTTDQPGDYFLDDDEWDEICSQPRCVMLWT